MTCQHENIEIAYNAQTKMVNGVYVLHRTDRCKICKAKRLLVNDGIRKNSYSEWRY